MRLLFDISAHGFGHLMQALPVVQAIVDSRPDIELVLRSGHSTQTIRGTGALRTPFEILPPPEFTAFPIMHNAVTIDVSATIEKCLESALAFDLIVDGDQEILDRHRIDAVVSDICPFSLVAAQRTGRANVAMCSLQWADVLRFVPALASKCLVFIERLEAAYGAADSFLAPTPHCVNADLGNVKPIGVIARMGRNQRSRIAQVLGWNEASWIIIVTSGGMKGFAPDITIPHIPDTVWILPDWLDTSGDDRVALSQMAGVPFVDILASADLIVAKPGYGTIAEALANGIRLLLMERNDWVDAAGLDAFAARHGQTARFSDANLSDGSFTAQVEAALSTPPPSRIPATGRTMLPA